MATEIGLGASAAGSPHSAPADRRLAGWATGRGFRLDREVILDPDTVERFVEVGLAGDRSRATYRAALRRVGPLLTTGAPWEPRPASVARRQVAAPYTAGEVQLLRSDALDQPTASRRRAARAFLALGLGAGLDGRWVTRVAAGGCESNLCGRAGAGGGPGRSKRRGPSGLGRRTAGPGGHGWPRISGRRDVPLGPPHRSSHGPAARPDRSPASGPGPTAFDVASRPSHGRYAASGAVWGGRPTRRDCPVRSSRSRRGTR